MVLIIVSCLLILAITLYQVVQGIFSALVMAVLTTLCATLAFAAYEPLASLLYETQPAYADAAALIVSFVIPLIVLRLLADRFISGNVVLGLWANRIGGGILGIYIGMVMVGTLMIAVQMLPFGARVITYKPFDDSLQRSSSLAPFYCDEFVAGMMKKLSTGSLSATRELGQHHDNILLEAYCARNTADRYGRTDATPEAIIDAKVYKAADVRLASWRKDIPSSSLLGESGMVQDVVVRCEVDASARDEKDEKDPEQRWRLPATQFRLVTKANGSYWPVAYLTYRAGRNWKAHPAPKEVDGPVQLGKLIVVRPATKEAKSLIVDWVYRIPAEAEPSYIVFRRVAKAAFGEKSDFFDKPGKMPPALSALDREGAFEPEVKRRHR